MNSDTKNCQNCKTDFTIEPDDFSFYEKIKVPPPTFCPECRMIRRMSWRNERSWHKRICDISGKSVISSFSKDSPYKVYNLEYWKSDEFDSMTYGREYNFSKDFFTQFDRLLKDVPHPSLIQKNNVNCEYSNYSIDCKNCYVVASAVSLEDCSYCIGSVTSLKNSLDTHQSNDCEFCYEIVDCMKSYRLFFSQNCEACVDSYFLYDCKNCSNCVGCAGLRNKSYCIFNKQYSKTEYLSELAKLNINSRSGLLNVEMEFNKLKQNSPRKYAIINKAENCIGDDIINAKNCKYCFYARNDVENIKYSFKTFKNTKDGYDGITIWDNAELFYECVSVTGQRVYFSQLIWGGFEIEYSFNCFDCNNIFGCVGLRNKSYCIFNKQYAPNEYKEIVSKIRAQMKEIKYTDKNGLIYVYGEFLPSEMSPYGYNDTITQEFFPLNREKALEKGFNWQEPEEKKYSITIEAENIQDSGIPENITNEIIECTDKGECNHGCSQAFKLIPSEIAFYKQNNLPIPMYCPGCRHIKRVEKKNPMKLWHRKCMCDLQGHEHEGGCQNEFETNYSTERREMVYCESCYQKEVY